MEYRISALVSAYYAEPFLAARLDNLLEQCPAPQVIVICQRDSAEQRIAYDRPVILLTTPDIPTIYAAWNMGIEYAGGDYLTSANTDDLFYPGALAAMAAELDRTGADICHSSHDTRNTKGNVERWNRETGDLTKLRRKCFIGPMPVWRKSLHDRFGLFDPSYTVAGDYEFWLRAVSQGAKICFIPRPLGLYWERADSAEHRNRPRHNAERDKIRRHYGR